jgi:hypothetical protein
MNITTVKKERLGQRFTFEIRRSEKSGKCNVRLIQIDDDKLSTRRLFKTGSLLNARIRIDEFMEQPDLEKVLPRYGFKRRVNKKRRTRVLLAVQYVQVIRFIENDKGETRELLMGSTYNKAELRRMYRPEMGDELRSSVVRHIKCNPHEEERIRELVILADLTGQTNLSMLTPNSGAKSTHIHYDHTETMRVKKTKWRNRTSLDSKR